MMYVRIAAVLALFTSPALAQYQVPNHSVPIGRGAGVQGYGNAAPGAAGLPLVSGGSSVDPAYGPAGINGGGTGASTAAGARTNLGVTATGADTTYAFRANNLSDLGSIATARGNLIPANSLTLSQFPTIGAATVLGSVAGGTPAALTQTQLTALVNSASATLSGALPAWPGNTTTFFRGDGTYATLNAAALGGLGTGVAAALGVNVGSAGALVVNGGALGTPSSAALTTGTTIFGQNITWTGGIPASVLTGTLGAAQFPALTGDITTVAGALATTLATVNSNTGSFGSGTQVGSFTVNGKGLITAASNVTVTHASGDLALTGGTMSGAIAMGGNNITGGGTIAGTAITASTSVSTPIYASAGSHTFQSNGSTFAGLINTSQQWYLGTTSLTPASGTTLTVSQNTGGAPATSALGNALGQFVAADTTIGVMLVDTFGAQGIVGSRYAGGTQASKTAAIGAATTFSFGGQAWDGSAYGTGATLDFVTSASTWSGTNHGMAARIRTVSDGSTTITERWRVTDAGGMNLGATLTTLTAGEFGVNKISASGTAPGAGTAKMAWVAGTNSGSCKLISYAGTSTTPVTIVDNVGAGC